MHRSVAITRNVFTKLSLTSRRVQVASRPILSTSIFHANRHIFNQYARFIASGVEAEAVKRENELEEEKPRPVFAEHAVISTFDLFSVGVGPSSSHTVGPMRAGRIFINDLVNFSLLEKVHMVKITLCV